MPLFRQAKKDERRGGRRRNYERKVEEVGIQRWIPRGWANIAGTIMFGLLAIAVAVEAVLAIGRRSGAADPLAAAIVTVLLAWMTVSFARNRLED